MLIYLDWRCFCSSLEWRKVLGHVAPCFSLRRICKNSTSYNGNCRKESPSIQFYLFEPYPKDLRVFDLYWGICILKAFHAHKIILSPDQILCDIQHNNYSCCTFPISKTGLMGNSTKSTCHFPGKEGNSAAHRAHGATPPTSVLSIFPGSCPFLPFLYKIRFHWKLQLSYLPSF